MTLQVNIDLGYEFEVQADAGLVFDLLSDIPRSARHFPKVKRLEAIGPDTYRWELERIGVGQLSVQTIYAARYVANRASGTVIWSPLPAQGNAQLAGRWTIREQGRCSLVALHIKGELTLPFPSLMTMMVAPVAQAEFEKLVSIYIDSLTETLGREA